MRVDLDDYPSFSKTYNVTFPLLNGGLNVRDLDYRLDDNESPDVENLWWEDGVLQSRYGQVQFAEAPDDDLEGYTATEETFFGYMFFHIGTKIYYLDPTAATPAYTELSGATIAENRGAFFRYQDYLFYKNNGSYVRIEYTEGSTPFSLSSYASWAFTPTIIMNALPADASGDYYQSENRLSSAKTVTYIGDGTSTVYHLPVTYIDAVTLVKVNDTTKTLGTDYTVNTTDGTVTFTTAPAAGSESYNNVEITYTKSNSDALNAVLSCPYSLVGGGNDNLCILFGGCSAQPNAVFWNSNDNVSMNPGYFPMENYNLVGVTSEKVTGFGKQYSDLVVFKERSIGKVTLTTETVDDMDRISFTYVTVNPHIGCNIPWTIQTVENNLVFANTYNGVYIIRSTSPAYENVIDCISEKVNSWLLPLLRSSSTKTSTDDSMRYWLCVDDKVFLWDYEVSTYSDPAWFYFTNIDATAFLYDDNHNMYHLDDTGMLTKFSKTYADYGTTAINKKYRFPTQFMDTYERLKDVLYCIFSVRGDVRSTITVTYDSDYGFDNARQDLTNITVNPSSFSWTPRNLAVRRLGVNLFAAVAKRTPGCKHVRHFYVTLSNNTAGETLTIITAQIFYRYQGRQR